MMLATTVNPAHDASGGEYHFNNRIAKPAISTEYNREDLIRKAQEDIGRAILRKIIPDDYTSSIVNLWATSPEPVVTAEAVADIPDMVEKVKEVFGLNNVQISEIINISRPSLYNHISGKEVPHSVKPYSDLYELALLLESDSEVSPDIKKGLKSILIENKTLLLHLRTASRDKLKILDIAKKVSRKLRANNTPASGTLSAARRASKGFVRAG